jgi:hypothetical protein
MELMDGSLVGGVPHHGGDFTLRIANTLNSYSTYTVVRKSWYFTYGRNQTGNSDTKAEKPIMSSFQSHASNHRLLV